MVRAAIIWARVSPPQPVGFLSHFDTACNHLMCPFEAVSADSSVHSRPSPEIKIKCTVKSQPKRLRSPQESRQ